MAGMKERLIQFVLRGKDELSPEAKKSAAALEELRQEGDKLRATLDDANTARGLVKGLDSTQRAAEQSKRSLADTEQRIVDLRNALNTTPGAAGLQQSLKDAEREASRARKQLIALEASLAEQQQAAKAAGVDTASLSDEEARLAAEVEKAKQALADHNSGLTELEKQQAAAARAAAQNADATQSAGDTFAGTAKKVLAFAAAYITLDAAMGLVKAGLGLVRNGMAAVFAEGAEGEQALGQLQAALQSTGNAAGLTAEQLLEMADQLRDGSMLSTEQIIAAQTRLLSYTDVAGNEFPRAMQIIIDQSQRLGISVEQSAETVGKALQSPADAMTALGRQGFKLADGQKQLLERLVATGKTAEAQGIIMDMLTEAYGGSAAAARMGTAAGLWKTLTDAVGDFAGSIADSGAFDYVKTKLGEVNASLKEMADDGRLDALAQSLSDVFVNGAESIEKYLKKLEEVDFTELAEKASEMAKKVGPAIDETLTAGQYVTATLTTVWNTFSILVTSTAAVLAKGVQGTLGSVLLAGGQIAGFFGGSEIKAEAEGLYNLLGDLSADYLKQAKTDMDQIGSAWDFLDEKKAAGAKKQAEIEAEKTAAVKTELEQQRMLNQAHADQLVADQQRVVDAAASGQAAIKDMANAVNLIDAAKTVDQLEGLRSALLAAFREGRISQEEYAQATTLLNGRLKDLGGAAAGAADGVSDLEEKLGDLASVQAAISNAKTDVDINNIRAALRKLYNDGEITAAQYNAELKKTSDQQKELKKAVSDGAKEQDKQNEAMEGAIVTQEDLRRASGKRMEEERRAGGEAMERRRKEGDDAKKDMSVMEDFFSGVTTRAREPLAAMSAAALEVFDALRGIKSVDLSIDTSGLEATTSSLQKVKDQLAQVQSALANPMATSLGKWALATQRSSLQTQAAFLGEKAALQGLMERYERGGMSLKAFVAAAQSAKNSMNLLDESDLSSLESAIQSAQEQMKQMGESTRSTLEGLQDELDGLEGRQESIERRKFAARQRDLQAQLAEAQASGDATAVSNASRALGMLRQIEAATAQQRQSEEQKKRITEQAAASGPAASTTAPAKILRLQTDKGKSVEVSVGSDQDETRLLSILEDAGLRSI